jgi:N-methylhydantoinase B
LLREYELLEDATVIRRFDKAKFPPRGLAGGKDGARARFVIGPGTPEEREVSASGRYEMKAGAKFLLQTAGGGGYGSPAERDRATITHDIAETYVSRIHAAKDYGDI